MVNSFDEIHVQYAFRLQGIMAFALMNTTTMIACKMCSTEGISHLLFSRDLKVSKSQDLQQFVFQCWIEVQMYVVTCKSQAI